MEDKTLSDELWQELVPVFARAYPQEAVAAVFADGTWKEYPNVSDTPTEAFRLTHEAHAELLKRKPWLFLHSHPNGKNYPSDSDTIHQIATGWDWGIVAIKGNYQAGGVYGVERPEVWGDGCAIPPLLGRKFLWGVRDCWTLCRDWYRLNGYSIPAIPRARDPSIYPAGHKLSDQFAHYPRRLGFKEVARHERQAGDCALMAHGAARTNHCAIYLGESKYLHQPVRSLSEEWVPADEEKMLVQYSVQFWRPKK